MLEELASAEVLPVCVLAPVVQHVLVAHGEHVLQERQPRHHQDWNGGTPVAVAVGGGKRPLESAPVNGVAQKHEFVPFCNKVAEHDLKEVVLDGGAFHRK